MGARMSSRLYTFVIGMCLACTACGSGDAGRPPPVARAPGTCAGLLGSWSEVEPLDGTSVEEPNEDKVRRIDRGTLLVIDPGRMTLANRAERLDSRIVVEQLSDGSCVVHARDSLGRPMELAVSVVSERLMRMRNASEPRSPTGLYERH